VGGLVGSGPGSGGTDLTVSVSGGTGDVDLSLRYGALPGEFTYDCRPLRQGNEETCTRTAPDAGGWYVMLGRDLRSRT